jgi:hypothetical protein
MIQCVHLSQQWGTAGRAECNWRLQFDNGHTQCFGSYDTNKHLAISRCISLKLPLWLRMHLLVSMSFVRCMLPLSAQVITQLFERQAWRTASLCSMYFKAEPTTGSSSPLPPPRPPPSISPSSALLRLRFLHDRASNMPGAICTRITPASVRHSTVKLQRTKHADPSPSHAISFVETHT